MFKVFGRIRKKLVTKSSFQRYLIYATGEILLVVIGILIALQVNDWSEAKKRKQEEITTLNNLIGSLNMDIEDLDWQIAAFDKVRTSTAYIINHMEADLPYEDSLKFHFGWMTHTWDPDINTEVFEALKATNVNLISDDALKEEIITYYTWCETTFYDFISRYFDTIAGLHKNLFNTRFQSYGEANFDEIRGFYLSDDDKNSYKWLALFRPRMIPHDYEALKKDREFMYHLKGLKTLQFWYIEANLIKTRNKALRLIELLKAELKAGDHQ